MRNDTHGGLDFYYLAPWFGSETAYPLSLDLPLGATHFRDETIAAHLRGLLPDSPARLARVAAAVGEGSACVSAVHQYLRFTV